MDDDLQLGPTYDLEHDLIDYHKRIACLEIRAEQDVLKEKRVDIAERRINFLERNLDSLGKRIDSLEKRIDDVTKILIELIADLKEEVEEKQKRDELRRRVRIIRRDGQSSRGSSAASTPRGHYESY